MAVLGFFASYGVLFPTALSRYNPAVMGAYQGDRVLASILGRDPTALAIAWVAALRRDPTCRPPEVLDELEAVGPRLLEGLAEACAAGPPDLAADHYRSAVRDFSFLGGQLASRGASPTLVSRLGAALTECVALELDPVELQGSWRVLEVGLGAIVLETYCLGLQAKERARLEEVLEKHTPVIRLPGDVPALLVVGSPSRQILSMLLGRLLLEVARMGADVLLVDFTHAQPLNRSVLGVIEELLDHRKLQQRQVVVAALDRAELRELRARLGPRDNVRFCDSWAEGLALVLDAD